MTEQNLLESLNWRYAVKRFDSTRKLNEVQWDTLEKSLILSPSSYGLQPYQFLVVMDPGVRAQLTPASWNQTQVVDCSHFVVFTSKNEMTEEYISNSVSRAAEVRKIPKESMAMYQQMMVGDLVKGGRSKIIPEWAARQAYIALGNLMTCAAVLGIDACPMEGIDPVKYDEILKLKGTGFHTVVACAVGYRHPEDKYSQLAKVRFDRSDLIRRV